MKACNTCNWCPLQWDIVLREKIKGEVVHALFLASPTCLTQHLDTAGDACLRFTPADLLVMQKSPKMSLVRYFDLRTPKIFKTSRFNIILNQQEFPLHFAAACSESLELMQYLLQAHFAAVTACGDDNEYYDPLSYFVYRTDFPTFDSMLQCLLDACSDSDVIGLALIEVLIVLGKEIGNSDRILKLVEILLKANPSAAKYTDPISCITPFREVGRLKDPICALSVMKMLLVHFPLGLEVINTLGTEQNLPIHVAVQCSTVEVVKFMLQVYPSSIESTADPGLMHCAVRKIEDAGMVQYLCSIAPQLLHTLSGNKRPLAYLCDVGIGPGHEAALKGRYLKVLSMCNTDPTIVTMPSWRELPLHILLKAVHAGDSPTSDFGGCFRLLLRLHPSSAGALDHSGNSSISIAVQKKMDDYFIRLLLSASTDAAHKVMLSEYNYKSRRCLLFLSFLAVSRSPQANIFARLRQSHPESLRVVASFL